jgi:hypothetical protein
VPGLTQLYCAHNGLHKAYDLDGLDLYDLDELDLDELDGFEGFHVTDVLDELDELGVTDVLDELGELDGFGFDESSFALRKKAKLTTLICWKSHSPNWI